ncbi:MAG TPA: GNAT family N-acetyltransferase, partial [Thermoanaerobaculia bacterium]|nr:GNAT family N-acetyltransferase [Thermoanaerobaculia bacterium]
MNVREGGLRDRDAILALRRAAFPRDDLEKQRADFWHWQFDRGRIFVAEEGGRVVGHLGFVPWRIGGDRVPAMLGCD